MAEKDATARLRRAVKENNLFLVKRLIQRTEMRNPDPAPRKFTSLAWAAVLGHEETFEFLLSAGHDDDELSRDAENNTILMLLADLKPDSSSSPFHSRIPGEDGAAAVRMCRMYYDRYTWILDWSNSQGKTALHIAALKGNEELVRMLCDLGADFNLADNKGNTSLHYASSWGHISVVQLLIERGCQYSARNNDGYTASDYAYSFSTRDTLQDTARVQFENNKKSRRNIFAQAAARGNEWGGSTSIPVPTIPPHSYNKPLPNGGVRMRSGSGGSRTTATSDSGDQEHGHSSPLGYSNGSTTVYPINGSGSSSTTFSAPSPAPALSNNPAAALSPIATRMRERDQDAMEKYLRRNRSGSGSTDTKSHNGSNFSSVGPSPNGDDIMSLPPSVSGSTTRKILRPSASAAQLRSNTQPTPSIITIGPTPISSESFRSRSGTNPSSTTRPIASTLSPGPVLTRSSSTSNNSRQDRYSNSTVVVEETGDFTGPSHQFAQFPDPPPESPTGSTPTGRRLPFHLLTKTMGNGDTTSMLAGHRRGASVATASSR